MWSSKTDDQLYEAYLLGDTEAFLSLYERHEQHLRRVIGRIVRDPFVVDDVFQITLARLHAHRNKFAIGTNFVAWATQIAKNAAREHLRGRRDRMVELTELLGIEAKPDSERMRSEMREAIDRVLNDMLKSERTLIRLHYFDEKSDQEIGNQLGIERDAAKKRRLVALENLRKFWKKHEQRTTASRR